MFLVFKAYWPSVRVHPWTMFWILLFLTGAVATIALRPFTYEELTNVFAANIRNADAAFEAIGKLGVLLVAGWICWRALDIKLASFESGIMADLEKRTHAALHGHSMRFFETEPSGAMVKKAAKFVGAFEKIADALCYQITRDMLLLTLTLGIFWWKRPDLVWLFVVMIMLFMILNALLVIMKLPIDTKAAEASSAVSAHLADSLGGVATVKSYAREPVEQAKIDALAEKSHRLRMFSWWVSIIGIGLQGMLMIAFEIVFLQRLVREWEAGTTNVGELVFFQGSVATLFYLIWLFGHNIKEIFMQIADSKEMAAIMDQEPEVRDAPNPKQLTVTEGAVSFQGVNFSYTDNCVQELTDLNLDIRPGETVALVGHTGAGKTTAVKLLMRFFNLRSGLITIDGQDIAGVTQSSLRSAIAVVQQDPYLFHGSLAMNIAYGRPDATPEEIFEAAVKARLGDLVKRLKNGLDTVVGEKGVKLSGGERQRVAIARAILANRPILVLDEATASLDSKTELAIQEALAELLKGRTCIAIAHRLSTIRRARIVVLKDGKIAVKNGTLEIGTHDELLALDGEYADLWRHQNEALAAD